MNIFIIPSWYPSKSNHLNGIFVKEQTLLLAQHFPDINFGISCWGQNDEQYLLHSKQPLRSLKKFFTNNTTSDKRLKENVVEFFTPAYSYHQCFNKGNINQKIKACHNNLERFKRKFGNVNIIHAHVSYPGGYIAWQLSLQTGIPYIITEHMAPFPQKYHLTNKGSLKPEIKKAFENAHALTAVSNYMKSQIKANGIKKSVVVIPNFIDPSLFKTCTVKRNTTFTFITVCGMLKAKGIIELLQGIALSVQIDRSIKFIFLGDGPDLHVFQQKAIELNLTDHITWIGFKEREEVSKYFSMADAHILCSHYESFGVAYIEAMIMGLPNIAAAIGGPLDIVDKETGILIKRIDPGLIAEKVLWMKNHYNLFDQQKIKKSFEKRFSVETVAPKIKKVYNSII